MVDYFFVFSVDDESRRWYYIKTVADKLITFLIIKKVVDITVEKMIY